MFLRTFAALLSAGWLLVLGNLPSALGTEAIPPRRLVVTELKPSGVAAELATSLTDVLLEALRSRPGYRVMGRSEIAVILELENQRQLLGCGDEGCLAQLGSAMKADLLCGGTIGQVGGTWLVSLHLTEVKSARVVARASETAMSQDELVAAVRRAAEGLIAPPDGHGARVSAKVGAVVLKRKPSMAVLDLTASGVGPQVVENLTQVVVHELKDVPKATVISRDEVRALLAHGKEQALMGCDDASCLAELGGALGVEYLVAGNVGRVGDTWLLHLKLIAIKEARTVNRSAESFVGEEAQLISAARYAARGLVGLDRDGKGDLEVTPSVSDARLLVDGQPVAKAGVQSLTAGKYNLRLEADGYAPWFSDVYVAAASPTRLNVSLQALAKPWYRKWWVWTVVGVVAAGGATTAAVLATRGAGKAEATHSFEFNIGFPQK